MSRPQVMLVKTDNVNQANSHRPQVGTSYSQKHMAHVLYPISHAQRRRQLQPGRVPQAGTLKRHRLGIVLDMSGAFKSCSLTSTTLTRPSPTSGYSYFKTHKTHFLDPNFSREIEWVRSQICPRPPSHAHRPQQRQQY